MTFDVIIKRDEDGKLCASVPALPGCHTQGETREELLENVKDAIALWLESRYERTLRESHLQDYELTKVAV